MGQRGVGGTVDRAQGEMTLLEHLTDLRLRIIGSSVAILLSTIPAYVFYDHIVTILFRPFQSIESMGAEARLYVGTLFEGFTTKIKISLLAGVILSFPVHLYNAIRFVFPGLTGKEKRVVVAGLGASFLLVVFSVYYSYFSIIPISVRFLTGPGFIPAQVGMILGYEKNIFTILQFIFVSLVVFQSPVLLEILLIMNVVTRKTLLRLSRFVVVGIFILAAILTPPDFVSQVSIAVPLVGLYFLTILIARIFRWGEER